MKKARVQVGPNRYEVREVPDDYVETFPLPAPPAPSANPIRRAVALECVHVGRVLTGAERNLLGLDHRKKWVECEHPELPSGKFVCSCGNCNKKCSGFETIEDDEPGEQRESG